MIDKNLQFTKTQRKDEKGNEYLGITAKKAGYQLAIGKKGVEGMAENPGRVYRGGWEVEGEARDLVFVPYYFRANRGGKGHMRVGLKRIEVGAKV